MNKTVTALIAVVVVVAIAIGVSTNNNNKNKKTVSSNSSTSTGPPKEDVVITGAGSTFAAPLYSQLGSTYKTAAGTTINYQAVGSGAGIAQFTANTVNFGATDVALKDTELAAAQVNGTPLDIPTAFGAVTVSYNIPGVKSGLKLDGPTIANIYMGTITNWNDPAIGKLNPGMKLPDLAISPVYRSDSSGTTAQFTQFLTDVSPTWAQQLGTGKTVKWPVGTGSSGNTGVAATTSQTSGAIGYVELAYALQNKFTTASVKDKAGAYVSPTLDSTSKAGENLPNLPSDLRFTAINSPTTGAYPIASATFIVVYQDTCKAHEVTSSAQAVALKGWLNYLLGSGQQSMKQLEYAPLPNTLLTKAQAKVSSLQCNAKAIAD
jgi:phosphate transport system substrate-binding protein